MYLQYVLTPKIVESKISSFFQTVTLIKTNKSCWSIADYCEDYNMLQTVL